MPLPIDAFFGATIVYTRVEGTATCAVEVRVVIQLDGIKDMPGVDGSGC